MARIEITRDTATPAIKRALFATSRQQRMFSAVQLMLEDIGEYLLRSTRERQEQEISPTGEPWVPLSPKYAKWKARKRPGVKMLKFDWHMMGDQFAYQVQDDELFVGTNAIYGRIHQFGGESKSPETGETIYVPPRPWLGLSTEDRAEVIAIAHDHLSGLFDA